MVGALVLDRLESIQAPQCSVGPRRSRLVAVLGTRSTDGGHRALGEAFAHLVRDLASRRDRVGNGYSCRTAQAESKFIDLGF
ncbi:hypothetical protein D3C80_1832090 [compost metagenome]